MSGLSARHETSDGSRPEASPLDAQAARAHRLPAFTLLEGGDVFDAGGAKADPGGLDAALATVEQCVVFKDHAKTAGQLDRVRADITRQLAGNPSLAGRMRAAKPVVVDLVSGVREMVRLGYPRSVSRHASGLFWDKPDWPHARIAVRADRLDLDVEKALVFHEYGHAIHYLAFTKEERKLIYQVLRPIFGHPADMDEVFAIYTEREFLGPTGFAALEKKAPGVYGYTRRQWQEDHAFAAFVRKLYFPHKPVVAGDKGRAGHAQWQKFMGG